MVKIEYANSLELIHSKPEASIDIARKSMK